jgi:hypothetical protein
MDPELDPEPETKLVQSKNRNPNINESLRFHNTINNRTFTFVLIVVVMLKVMLKRFYVTDGNIMYLTDASRSLISCVIQHYAPVMGWGGGGTDA